MRREDKNVIIDALVEKLNQYPHFYLTDISALNAYDTFALRKKCYEKDIALMVVKNTLLRKALEKSGNKFEELYGVLKQSTSIMFSETGNTPAKLIREFRKDHDKPILKAAFVEESIYLGDESLELLTTLKSKNELIAEVISLLQSPMRNVISSLQSGGNKVAGLVKALSEKK
jgi:large subunit ribosomal protein L10